MRPRRGVPAEVVIADQRPRIIDAILSIMAEDREAESNEICRIAGVGKKAIYNCFGSVPAAIEASEEGLAKICEKQLRSREWSEVRAWILAEPEMAKLAATRIVLLHPRLIDQLAEATQLPEAVLCAAVALVRRRSIGRFGVEEQVLEEAEDFATSWARTAVLH